ncbi:hypothetical protein GRF29_96g702335 [Pseudopithomyces chartarum]|uniref:Acylphosphatase-like domain-containing protein n=1 Tax=Pseudopithomyces chartarum TaxID=1892770 RepID=A0AAN6LUI5_9PLEO|nr:hypothetical protein GRF29_96g702335 [Pseudopithomyces chartarum]
MADKRVRRSISKPVSVRAVTLTTARSPSKSTVRCRVQGEAQGSSNAIEEFVQHLNKGPSAASVKGVEHNDISTKSDESSFNVQ